MSLALISGQVLTRQTRSFKNRDGEQVEYHEALVFDQVNKSLTVVRSGQRADLAAFEPGTDVVEQPGTFREQTNVPAALVRPGLGQSSGSATDW